jgi:hypothetical protein
MTGKITNRITPDPQSAQQDRKGTGVRIFRQRAEIRERTSLLPALIALHGRLVLSRVKKTLLYRYVPILSPV